MAKREDPGPPFQVHSSSAIVQALKRVQRQAAQEGRGDKVLAAIRQIHQQLCQAPNETGEPLYGLPGLRMQVRTVVVRPLAVDFAVCEDRPLVFIKSIGLLAGPTS